MPDDILRIPIEGGLLKGNRSSSLIVILHAFNQAPRRMHALAETVRENLPDGDILVPKLPFSVFSLSKPDAVAEDVLSKIDALDCGKYKEITFIGHSIGAIMARKVWVLAHGAAIGKKGSADPKPWASKIRRIVQLAALNRGWVISSALNPGDRIRWSLGKAWGNFCRHALGRDPLIFGFQRGAPFLTTLRLECLALETSLGQHAPLVVQLIGTVDDMVAPTDNVDLATGASFSYIEVPNVTHQGIADATPASYASIRLAVCGTKAEIAKVGLDPRDVYDLHSEAVDDYDMHKPVKPDNKVGHIVFVIHGIRDRGFWTRRIARVLKTKARENHVICKTVTSTYGFFAMGPFLVPWIRRDKVHWLLDQYVTAKSIYPNAEISYIGHSNGTYLLAKALSLCPAVKINRAIFAGSVVRSDFRWNVALSGQVSAVVNYVATKDWVVAIFPNGLQKLGQDLGGAGHNGFEEQDGVVNVRYVEGSHGAALEQRHWNEMSDFIFNGTLPPPDKEALQDCSMRRLGQFSALICVAIVVAIAGILLLILAQFRPFDLIWLAVLSIVTFAIKTTVTKL